MLSGLCRLSCCISIHALRGEGDLASTNAALAVSISIHALRGEGDENRRMSRCRKPISIHALRGEGDKEKSKDKPVQWKFQSTPSVGRATKTGGEMAEGILNFNPRPPWGGRRDTIAFLNIAIDFNPRPPWGGRLWSVVASVSGPEVFQSTPSVGRATAKLHLSMIDIYHFNPRPPWGGRRARIWHQSSLPIISIHALRGEGDTPR